LLFLNEVDSVRSCQLSSVEAACLEAWAMIWFSAIRRVIEIGKYRPQAVQEPGSIS
jgi:hypothetical protein